MQKRFLIAGALFGGTAVALGAFGAHSLEKILTEHSMNTFHTAVEYQFYHTFALLITALISERSPSRFTMLAGNFFIAGIILFSGSLYLLASVESLKWMGAVTPIGGICFLAGWVLLLISFLRRS